VTNFSDEIAHYVKHRAMIAVRYEEKFTMNKYIFFFLFHSIHHNTG